MLKITYKVLRTYVLGYLSRYNCKVSTALNEHYFYFYFLNLGCLTVA